MYSSAHALEMDTIMKLVEEIVLLFFIQVNRRALFTAVPTRYYQREVKEIMATRQFHRAISASFSFWERCATRQQAGKLVGPWSPISYPRFLSTWWNVIVWVGIRSRALRSILGEVSIGGTTCSASYMKYGNICWSEVEYGSTNLPNEIMQTLMQDISAARNGS